MSKTKEPVITVSTVYAGTKTDRQALMELILQRQMAAESIDGGRKIRYNEVAPNMRYTQTEGEKI